MKSVTALKYNDIYSKFASLSSFQIDIELNDALDLMKPRLLGHRCLDGSLFRGSCTSIFTSILTRSLTSDFSPSF
jgi:hypothetical protein